VQECAGRKVIIMMMFILCLTYVDVDVVVVGSDSGC
jgi:hypothetical protein